VGQPLTARIRATGGKIPVFTPETPRKSRINYSDNYTNQVRYSEHIRISETDFLAYVKNAAFLDGFQEPLEASGTAISIEGA